MTDLRSISATNETQAFKPQAMEYEPPLGSRRWAIDLPDDLLQGIHDILWAYHNASERERLSQAPVDFVLV